MRMSGASGGTPSLRVRDEDAERLEAIGRVLAIVAHCLREMFPNDFYRRCAFSAFASRALLREAGLDAAIVGGRFAALVIAADGSRSAVQGFNDGSEPFPHLWVEAEGRLVDLGPWMLGFGSGYEVLPMPALAWNLSAPFPPAIRYRPHERLAETSQMSPDPAVRDQGDDFVARCRTLSGNGPHPALETWIVTDETALHTAAKRGDGWAHAARRFEPASLSQPLPF